MRTELGSLYTNRKAIAPEGTEKNDEIPGLRTCLSLLGIVIKFGEVYFGRRPKAIQEISE